MLGRIQETAGRTGTLLPLPGMHGALRGTLSLQGDPVRARGAGDRGPGAALAESLGWGSSGWGSRGSEAGDLGEQWGAGGVWQ